MFPLVPDPVLKALLGASWLYCMASQDRKMEIGVVMGRKLPACCYIPTHFSEVTSVLRGLLAVRRNVLSERRRGKLPAFTACDGCGGNAFHGHSPDNE
ncbi:hypothetical protein J6524_05315 [Bradyrhizobium sp. WSM 1738]|uniref:hypothetical protein n=1 Tax=Bradyrhizobium hereditatis TaxID=2821405 RepID=UPI001CE32B47|nr:hypothetical protein [Bradyrhizobium hereditatis]MCA6114348.1 hypothetical protein [Bradyrhizobium hereditatis]